MKLKTVVGWGIGLAAIAATFFLPFWSLTPSSSGSFETLYGLMRFIVYNLNDILSSGSTQGAFLALFLLIGGLIVAISGLFGVNPSRGGVLGIIGMAALTAGPILLVQGYVFSASTMGIGYWALWVLSVANIVLGIVMRERKPVMSPSPQIATGPSPPVPQPVTAPQKPSQS